MDPNSNGFGGNAVGVGLSSAQNDNRSNHKIWIIVLIGFIFLGILIGCIYLFNNSGVFKGTVTAEMNDEAISILVEQSDAIQSINYDLERGLNGKWGVVDFFEGSISERMNNYLETMNAFAVGIDKINGFGYSDEIKDIIRKYKTSLEGYISKTTQVLEKLKMIIDAFIDDDVETIESFANENDIDSSVKNNLLDYAKRFEVIKPVLDNCKSNNEECEFYLLSEYQSEVRGSYYVVKAIFESIVTWEDIVQLRAVEDAAHELRATIEDQYESSGEDIHE